MPKVDSTLILEDLRKQKQKGDDITTGSFNLGINIAITIVEMWEKLEEIRRKK